MKATAIIGLGCLIIVAYIAINKIAELGHKQLTAIHQHVFTKWSTPKAPGFTTAVLMQFRTCTNCGYAEARTIQ